MRTWPRTFSTLLVGMLATACAATPDAPSNDGLTIVAWNLEHLAEADGSGCRSRTAADYEALARFAQSLDADVVAFQEVESAAAAQRVFPADAYTIVIEERPGTTNSKPPCYGSPELRLNRQAVGFAIRKSLAFDRHPDLTALQVGDPNLRSGVDVTLKPDGQAPIRLLAVHLKSGCAGGGSSAACDTLQRQAEVLVDWSEARGSEGSQFALLGDFNRRLALPSDGVWSLLDDPPGPADLVIASGTQSPGCDPRYSSFIDHVLLDQKAVSGRFEFKEWTFDGTRLSDHCPVGVVLPDGR